MRKSILFFISMMFVASGVWAANNFMPKRFNTVTSHDDIVPYRLNNAQLKKNSTNTINSTGTTQVGKRNVVKRKTNARAATTTNANAYVPATRYDDDSSRRVVPRTNTVHLRSTNSNSRKTDGREYQDTAVRSANIRTTTTRTTSGATATTKVSSQRCFADYKECMEMYCLREDTAYNRCYCSAKLAQIDSKYQNKIDNLLQQIVRLQYGASVETSEEIKEYWDQTIGVYTNDNPWVNIENALNIEWADAQSRTRGQNAFNTGHEYCVQHLRACSYMASNLRDAYKSEIARDCETYEKSLQRIQNAAESVIESYKK